jgi:tRNA(Ser,Leu) C12 N-acetylase TAN1
MAKKEANLLVTFDPSHLESAKKEILDLLKETKEKAEFLNLDSGFAEIAVGNAKKAVSNLEKIAKKSIQKFNYTMQWIPIEKWCENKIEDIKKNIKGFVKDIGENEKWKMELKTRKLKEKPDEIKLILKLTEAVDRKKVDLNEPEKIIKVEIIGNRAGLALLKKNELLNVAKLKQLKK